MLHLLEATFRPLGKLGRLTWPVAAISQLQLAEDVTQFGVLASETIDERAKVSKTSRAGSVV